MFHLYILLVTEIYSLVVGKHSPPPPPPDVAQNDLMLRLGLLLGDRNQGNETVNSAISPICQGNQTEETFTSVSSLGSSDHTPDRGISDTSPLSTLTGNVTVVWPLASLECSDLMVAILVQTIFRNLKQKLAVKAEILMKIIMSQWTCK